MLITLAILLAATVALSTSGVTKDAFAADPITNCFSANAIANPAYFQAVQNFKNAIPNDQLLISVAANAHVNPPQNEAELYALLTNPNLIVDYKNDVKGAINSLLEGAGFAPLQLDALKTCVREIG